MTTTRVIIPQPLTAGTRALASLVERCRASKGARLRVFYDVASLMVFKDVQIMLGAYEHWDHATPEWEDLHDYYYDTEGITVRTTVDMGAHVALTHTQSRKLGVLLMEISGHGRARAVLVEETGMGGESVPEMVLPTKVNIRRRLVYLKGAWRIELMCVWTGSSRSAAELMQSTHKAVYRVSVEFRPPDAAAYWGEACHTPEYVAASMLMKLLSVVSGEMVRVTLPDSECD